MNGKKAKELRAQPPVKVDPAIIEQEATAGIQASSLLIQRGFIPLIWWQESTGEWIGQATNTELHKTVAGKGPSASALLVALLQEAQRPANRLTLAH